MSINTTLTQRSILSEAILAENGETVRHLLHSGADADCPAADTALLKWTREMKGRSKDIQLKIEAQRSIQDVRLKNPSLFRLMAGRATAANLSAQDKAELAKFAHFSSNGQIGSIAELRQSTARRWLQQASPLIAFGADIHARDAGKKSVLDYLRGFGSPRFVRNLKRISK